MSHDDSRVFQTGIQYLSVDSMRTSRQLFSESHFVSRRKSFVKVEKRLGLPL